MKNSRTGILICAVVSVLIFSFISSGWSQPGGSRSYVTGNSFLVLDGVKSGFVKSVSGGAISAEVINEPAGPSYFVKKHIGQPKYQEFEIQIGFDNESKIYDWIRQSWQMNYKRTNGSILSADHNLNVKSERQFTQALITATTIPTLDGSSKEPAYITVKFAPETIRVVKSGGNLQADAKIGASQKIFLPSNFRLQIDGLDCSKVSRIESFTVKQTTVTDDIGEARDYMREPGKLEFPNLKITIPEIAADSFVNWHQSFVIQGNNDDTKEKNGILTLLTPNRSSVLAIIEFKNLGIFRIQPVMDATSGTKNLQIEMYVERMTFLRPPSK